MSRQNRQVGGGERETNQERGNGRGLRWRERELPAVITAGAPHPNKWEMI